MPYPFQRGERRRGRRRQQKQGKSNSPLLHALSKWITPIEMQQQHEAETSQHQHRPNPGSNLEVKDMPVFNEDPAHLSKSKLKTALVAHNVSLPPAKSKKEVYVELHLKHIEQKNAADFSSDEEEEQVPDVAEEEKDAEMPNPSGLTDDDLKAALLKHGVKAGPIVASTRALYEKKLRKLLESEGHARLNGAEKAVLYSDSEEEEEEEEEEGSEVANEENVEQSNQDQQESSENGGFYYPQCFSPPLKLHARASRNREPSSKRNSKNALKSSERSRPQIPAGISRPSSVDQRPGLGSGGPSGAQPVRPKGCSSSSSPQSFSITQLVEEMECRRSLSTSGDTEKELNGSSVQDHWSRSNRPHTPIVDKNTMTNQTLYHTPKNSPYKRETKIPQEPAKITFNDMFPDVVATPTGITATCRRPIKGAAGRPVQYAYPDSPVSPATLERREAERRLVPIHIQIAVLLTVAFLLYVIYGCVEENSFTPFLALLDGQDEGLLLQAETQDTPALSGQE